MSDNFPPSGPSPWIAPNGAPNASFQPGPTHPAAAPSALAVRDHGLGTAFGLVMQTLPYALMRFGVLLGASLITILWLSITLGGGAWISDHIAHVFGAAWIIAGVTGFGFGWWGLVRYALHLIECGHVAVLTELITDG